MITASLISVKHSGYNGYKYFDSTIVRDHPFKLEGEGGGECFFLETVHVGQVWVN